MCRFIHIFLFITFNQAIFGQVNSIQASYNTILSFGVGNSSGINVHSTLDYNGDLSLFTYKSGDLEDGQSSLNKSAATEGAYAMLYVPIDKIGELSLIDHSKKRSLQRKVLKKKAYLILRENDIPSWKLSKDTKKLGAYQCQKATTSYRGREYTAWFAKDIPYSIGPWMLYGLPGMIVEAYDNDKEVHFQLVEVQIIDKEISIPIPIDGDPISTQDFWNLYLDYEKMKERNGRLLAESFKGAVTNYQPLDYYSRIELYSER